MQIYFWLGMLKHKKHFIAGIPKGYEISQELRNVERPRALPPSVIHYVEKHVKLRKILKFLDETELVSRCSNSEHTFTRPDLL